MALADHAVKRVDQFTALHTAHYVDDMNIPHWRLHELKEKLKGHWAMTVNKNWRVVFRLTNEHPATPTSTSK